MKNRRPRGVLLVPPGGARIRTIRVSRILVAASCIVVAAGLAGYFIPFNDFTIDVVKQNQERNLELQNRKLLDIMRPLDRLRVTLSTEMEHLDRKRAAIQESSGKKEDGRRQIRTRIRRAEPGADELVAKVKKTDEMFRDVLASVTKRPGCFDSIPLIRPVEGNPVVSARFDMEKDPFTGVMKRHYGTDFIGMRGAPVLATASGTVARVEDNRLWGKRIIINHGFGYSTMYAHLGTVDAFTGKKVKKGDCIGTMGISGVTSGPHVHYEIWYQGAPVDPETMFFPDIDSSVQTVSLQ
jgi:murein DD-endopeptidase MepM/ murein hydrolase activator NlpD